MAFCYSAESRGCSTGFKELPKTSNDREDREIKDQKQNRDAEKEREQHTAHEEEKEMREEADRKRERQRKRKVREKEKESHRDREKEVAGRDIERSRREMEGETLQRASGEQKKKRRLTRRAPAGGVTTTLAARTALTTTATTTMCHILSACNRANEGEVQARDTQARLEGLRKGNWVRLGRE